MYAPCRRARNGASRPEGGWRVGVVLMGRVRCALITDATAVSRSLFDILLSATSKDLKPHRDAVRDVVSRLRQSAVCMETFGARPDRPLVIDYGHAFGIE